MSDSEDLEEIRRAKARELMEGLSSFGGENTEEEHEAALEEINDILPWGFRTTIKGGETYAEILHHPQLRQSEGAPNIVAITPDADWADMVTNMLNRAFLFHESGLLDVVEGEKSE